MYSDDLKKKELDKESVERWRRKERVELTKRVMRKFPDRVAIEIIERHTELNQSFTEIAHVLKLDRHTVSYKYHRVLPIIKNIVESKEKK